MGADAYSPAPMDRNFHEITPLLLAPHLLVREGERN